MRKAAIEKRVFLNKRTISSLNVGTMLRIRGGLPHTETCGGGGDTEIGCEPPELSDDTTCPSQHVKTKDHALCLPDDTDVQTAGPLGA